ncbi:MAG: hypothetical protein KGZ93_11460 [Actinobacteria bacterium]|nr:hypothetical protein [Actinomycetota bacterium]
MILKRGLLILGLVFVILSLGWLWGPAVVESLVVERAATGIYVLLKSAGLKTEAPDATCDASEKTTAGTRPRIPSIG